MSGTERADDGRKRKPERRVGSTPKARVRWLLNVALMGDTPTAKDTATLQRDLAFFLGRRHPLTATRALHLQRRIRRGVARLEEGHDWPLRPDRVWTFTVPSREKAERIRRYRAQVARSRGLLVPMEESESGEVEALSRTTTVKRRFDQRVIAALVGVGGKLRRCQRPECPRLFIQRKRAIYCSRRCGWVVRKRRRRASATTGRIPGSDGDPASPS